MRSRCWYADFFCYLFLLLIPLPLTSWFEWWISWTGLVAFANLKRLRIVCRIQKARRRRLGRSFRGREMGGMGRCR